MQELADTDEKSANTKEDVVGTKESLSNETCSMTDNEWEERRTKSLAIEAVLMMRTILSIVCSTPHCDLCMGVSVSLSQSL